MKDVLMKRINKDAIECIDKLDIKKAEKLFLINAKQNPCNISFHNLCYFYYNEGKARMLSSRRKIVSKNELVKLLRKAIQFEENELSYALLGKMYIEYSEFENAIKATKRAADLINSETNYYQLSVALLQNKRYEEAKKYLDLVTTQGEEKESVSEIRGVCLAHIGNISEAEAIAKSMLIDIKNYEQWTPTAIYIYYLTNNYSEIISCYNEVTKYYQVDDNMLKAYLWSLFQLKKNSQAEDYVQKLKSELNEEIDLQNKRFIINKIKRYNNIFKDIAINGKKPEIEFIPSQTDRNFYIE